MYMYIYNFIILVWEIEYRLSGIVFLFIKYVFYMYYFKFIIIVKL